MKAPGTMKIKSAAEIARSVGGRGSGEERDALRAAEEALAAAQVEARSLTAEHARKEGLHRAELALAEEAMQQANAERSAAKTHIERIEQALQEARGRIEDLEDSLAAASEQPERAAEPSPHEEGSAAAHSKLDATRGELSVEIASGVTRLTEATIALIRAAKISPTSPGSQEAVALAKAVSELHSLLPQKTES